MIKGDKIKLIKSMGVFTNVGEVCEVTDIREDGSIWFRFGGMHLGCMSYDEYEKYFDPVEKKVKREWSDWKCYQYDLTLEYDIRNNENNVTCIEESIGDFGKVWYRDNGKRIQVRIEINGKYFKSSAICCHRDVFNFQIGMKLALKRLFPKVLAYLAEYDAKNM